MVEINPYENKLILESNFNLENKRSGKRNMNVLQ